MQQALRSTASTITVEFRDSAGALVDATGAVPVAITDGAGAAVTSGNATHVSLGEYSYVMLPAFTANLDTYTATWTPTIAAVVNTYTTQFETVGGFYFSLPEARGYFSMGGDPGLDDTGAITDQEIVDTRTLVQERFEREAATSFVPRGARNVVDGDPWNPSRLVLRRPETAAPVSYIRKINSITIDGTAMAAPDLANVHIYADEGALVSLSASFFGFGYRNIVIWFEYGYDQAPLPIKRAALEYCRHLLVGTNQDTRQINTTTEMDQTGQTFRGPSRFRPTGLPGIDSVLWRYCDRIPGFA